MLELLQQCQSLFNDAIDREISRRHQLCSGGQRDAKAPHDEPAPDYCNAIPDVPPVANAGDGIHSPTHSEQHGSCSRPDVEPCAVTAWEVNL